VDGVGVTYVPEPLAAPWLADGRLVPVLEDHSRQVTGVFLYHPSRRHTPMPLQVFLRFIERQRRSGPPAADG
jgi:DNA-binding transcriptional LysR family regulator